MATNTTNDILARALALSEKDRAKLVHEILLSLDGARDDDWEASWRTEIDRRLQDIDSGAVEPLSGPAVMRELRAEFPRRPPMQSTGRASRTARRR